MKYTPEEVMQFVKGEEVKFIRLAFCDVYGKQHNVAIMPSELKRAFEFGIAIDASRLMGSAGRSVPICCCTPMHPRSFNSHGDRNRGRSCECFATSPTPMAEHSTAIHAVS